MESTEMDTRAKQLEAVEMDTVLSSALQQAAAKAYA